MTRKKKVQKPKPFKTGPWVIAYCGVELDGTRSVVFSRIDWRLEFWKVSEITGYSRWLLRAAAWVKDGIR